MGTNLIIKGADFSANAVDHEIVEPTVYISLAGYGPSGYTGYNEGDKYYRIATANGNTGYGTSCGFFKRENNASVKLTDIYGQFVKIGNAYYNVAYPESDLKMVTPYYGVRALDIAYTNEKAFAFTSSSEAPSEVSSSSLRSAIIPLTANKHYQFHGFGTIKTNNVIVKKANGTYVNITDYKSAEPFLVDYTPTEEGEQVYFSSSISFSVFWAAIVE